MDIDGWITRENRSIKINKKWATIRCLFFIEIGSNLALGYYLVILICYLFCL